MHTHIHTHIHTVCNADTHTHTHIHRHTHPHTYLPEGVTSLGWCHWVRRERYMPLHTHKYMST